MLEELLRDWGGEELVVRRDQPSDTWMLIGVHSTVLGPAMGGARMKPYTSLEEAVRDVTRLSQAMTVKQAAADLPYGGGKAVLAVPEVPGKGSAERRELLLRYGDLVAALGGTYVTAADMNTGAPDMDVIGERTTFVLGRSPSAGGSGDPAEATATGIFHGIRATLRRVFGADDLKGRRIAVQGVGSVGGGLAQRLASAGAEVLVADTNAERAEALAARYHATSVPAEAIAEVECDVFSPCATGAVLNADSISRLRCRAVAGAANNQLAEAADAARLQDRGILYAPDYVINGGGVIHLAGYETLGWDEARMRSRLEGIAATLDAIFEAAEAEEISTAEAADRLAESRLEAARGGRAG